VAIPLLAIKVLFGGSMPGGEEWSTSTWIQGTVLHDQTELTNILQALDTAMAAGGGFYATLKLFNGGGVTLPLLRAYQYNGGTKAAVQAEYNSAYTPTAGTPDKPNQVSIVTSLRTGLPGRSFRGRMYWPCTKVTMGTNGQTIAGIGQEFSNGLATSFGTFNAEGWGKLVVCSPATSATHQITEIVTDDVLDTQRRRRNKVLDSAPGTAAVAQ